MLASAVMPGADGTADDDAQLRQARRTPVSPRSCTSPCRSGTGTTTWDPPSCACSRRAAPREARTVPAGLRVGAGGPGAAAGLRDLTPAPGRALDRQSFCVSADGRTVATGWWAWEGDGDARAELAVIDVATGARRTVAVGPRHRLREPGDLTRRPAGRLHPLGAPCARCARRRDDRAVLARGDDPPEPPACAPRPRGGTSPTHRPLAGPEGPARWPVTSASP